MNWLELPNLNEQKRRRYEADLKTYRDNLATLDYAKEEGREIGREKSLELGLEKGQFLE